MNSLRLKNELMHLLVPYCALDFDQNMAYNDAVATTTVGELQTLEHIYKYGLPLGVVPIS